MDKKNNSVPNQDFFANIVENIIKNALHYSSTDPLKDLLARNHLVSPYPPKNSFRVMSYNILADSLNHTLDLIPHYEEKHRNWEYRSHLLVNEVKAYDPDILCLQEIEHTNTVFHQHFGDNYHIQYRRKPNDKVDGCMILAKKSKYEVIESHYLEFFIDENDPLLNKDNICVIVVLKPIDKNDNRVIIVATTHLLFNKNRGEIKTAQVHLALKACSQLVNKYHDTDVNIIYAGDFNSIPKSGIYEFIRNGEFDFRELNCRYLSGQNLGNFSNLSWFYSLEEFLVNNVNYYRAEYRNREDRMDRLVAWLVHLQKIDVKIKEPNGEMQKIEFDLSSTAVEFNPNQDRSWRLKNDFSMFSAYGSFQRFYYNLRNKKHQPEVYFPKYSTFEPLYSQINIDSMLTVDYIWYYSKSPKNGKKMKVTSLYELPRLSQAFKVSFFPNRIYPSDHMSLIVDFEFS